MNTLPMSIEMKKESWAVWVTVYCNCMANTIIRAEAHGDLKMRIHVSIEDCCVSSTAS
jgi:hypothetical protein